MKWRRQIPNALSVLRIFLAPLLIPLFEHRRWTLLLLLLLLAVISDAADGYLARRWDMSSRCGAWLDAIADKVLIWSVLAMLWRQRMAPTWFVLPLLLRDLSLLAFGAFLLRTQVWQQMRPSFSGKLAMALQMLSLLYLCLLQMKAAAVPVWLHGFLLIVLLVSWISLPFYLSRLHHQGKTPC